MSGNKKAARRAVACALAVMLSMGAVSLQPAAGAALAAHREQKALRGILDADLRPDRPTYDDNGAVGEATQPGSRRAGNGGTGGAANAGYADALLAETEAYTTDRFIVKYREGAAAPELGVTAMGASIGAARAEAIGMGVQGLESRFAAVTLEVAVGLSEFRQAAEASGLGAA